MPRLDVEIDPGPALLDAWGDVLDDFEAALDYAIAQAERAGDVNHRIDTSNLFRPPASMPPLPIELADRARQLVERNAAVIAQVTEASEQVNLPPSAGAMPQQRFQSSQRSTASSSFDARA